MGPLPPPAPLGRAYIYALRAPGSVRLTFVGRTRVPRQRYYQYLYLILQGDLSNPALARWTLALLSRGSFPELVVLAEVEAAHAVAAQREWIARLPKVFNAVPGAEAAPSPPDGAMLARAARALWRTPDIRTRLLQITGRSPRLIV